jgi:predicted Zn finger-like uncharacterized protein
LILRCEACGTVYHLDPNLLEGKGSKVRCTRCGHIFWVDAPKQPEEFSLGAGDASIDSFTPSSAGEKGSSPKIRRTGKTLRLVGAGLLLLFLAFSFRFVYLYYRHPGWKMNEVLSEVFFFPSDPQGRREIRLINHKKDFVENEKIGRIFVVEGEILNGYPTARRAIKIRGSLKTADNRVADTREVYAGWTLTREEIAALSPEDLQKIQTPLPENPIRDVQVLPGKKLPFLLLFPRPPRETTHVSIEVLSSRPAHPKPPSAPLSG